MFFYNMLSLNQYLEIAYIKNFFISIYFRQILKSQNTNIYTKNLPKIKLVICMRRKNSLQGSFMFIVYVQTPLFIHTKNLLH